MRRVKKMWKLSIKTNNGGVTQCFDHEPCDEVIISLIQAVNGNIGTKVTVEIYYIMT